MPLGCDQPALSGWPAAGGRSWLVGKAVPRERAAVLCSRSAPRRGRSGRWRNLQYRPAFARAREDGPDWLGVGGREGSVLVRC